MLEPITWGAYGTEVSNNYLEPNFLQHILKQTKETVCGELVTGTLCPCGYPTLKNNQPQYVNQ